MRSEGSRLLGAVKMTQRQIAGRIGVGRATVATWISGERVPNDAHRRALRAAFGIPVEAWPDTPESALRRLHDEATALHREIVAVLAERWPDALEAVVARISKGD